MSRTSDPPTLPLSAGRLLRGASRDLAAGRLRLVRLYPLLLRVPLPELLRRRCAIYSVCDHAQLDYGYTVAYEKRLRPSKQNPGGRTVVGQFDLLAIGQNLCIVMSALDSEQDKHGPRLLVSRAYPHARRPFLNSGALCDVALKAAQDNAWTATCVDAIGYDRRTHKFRRDMKRQGLEYALSEMAEQARDLHRALMVFRDRSKRQRLRASLDRYGAARIYAGSAITVADEFVLPAVRQAQQNSLVFSIRRESQVAEQRMVQLRFRQRVLESPSQMRSLCHAISKGDGLNVSTVHLNPYLQAQVLDFLSGEAIQLVVLDPQTVSLIPRSGESDRVLERVAATISRHFGESEITQERVYASGGR